MSYSRIILVFLLSLFLVSAAFAWGPSPWGYQNYQGPYGESRGRSQGVQKGIHVERGMDQRGYLVRIHLRGIETSAIEVGIVGTSLVIRSDQSTSTHSRGDFGERSFSHSFSMNRRIGIPFDADVSRMERNDAQGVIEIILPRRGWNYR